MSEQLSDLELLELSSKPENIKNWDCFIPLQKSFLDEALKNTDDSKPWKIGGYASTDDKDLENESISPEGLDIDYFLRYGWLNDDHQKGGAHKIGFPTMGRIDSKGLYVEGELIKEIPAAQGIYRLMKALASGNYDRTSKGRQVGFSIEGKVVQQEGNKIIKAWIKDIAVTANPVNSKTYASLIKSFRDCEVVPLSNGKAACVCHTKIQKGLEAGYETSNQTDGDALRVQDLESKLKINTFKGILTDDELTKYVKMKANVSDELAKKVVEYARLKKSFDLKMSKK